MKKVLLLVCFCLTLNYISAQNEMWIYKSNGTVVKYNTSEIDSIKFMPSQEPEDNVINISANCLIGNYYGESLVPGLGHYWIILTEDGFGIPPLSSGRADHGRRPYAACRHWPPSML